MKADPQTVRTIGLSYVRNQLSRRGWKVVSPDTSTRGVDFFAHPQNVSRKVTIKVRALSRRSAVPLGKTLDNLLADYMVVCRKVNEPNPECFILTTEEVKELANPNEKGEEVSYWLEPRDYETEQFRERWDRMGSGVPSPRRAIEHNKHLAIIRNPNWTRDELILALSLYMREGRRQLEASHPEVAKLSADLNKLPIHDKSLRGTDFRNPQGVSMKLGNFLSIDPLYEGLGLQRGGRLDREVWDEFDNDVPRLHQTAKSISESAAQIAKKPGASYDPVREDEEFPEGKLLTSVHRRRERDPKAVQRKKERVLKETGRLLCEACSFDFAVQYGKLGYGFAECHHTIPVGQLTEGHLTRLADLAIVCANCHRMIHRSRPILTVAQLSLIIKQNKH